MHRRRFLAASAALLLPAGRGGSAQTVATPSATPNHHGRPRPIVLGDGIELVDYRIYPSTDVPRIIGEISSTRDEMVDSPVISVTFPDLGEDGFAWAVPVLPAMVPGQSNLIFGTLPGSIESDSNLLSATFGLCGPVQPSTSAATRIQQYLEIEDLSEQHDEFSQGFRGTLVNTGDDLIKWPTVRGLVRDSGDRYVGCTPAYTYLELQPKDQWKFEIWSTSTVINPANPYRLLNGSSDYRGELYVGEIGPITAPGCPSVGDGQG